MREMDIRIVIGKALFEIFLDSSFLNNNSNRLPCGPRHDHSLYEIHLVKNGTGIITVDNEKLEVYPGSVFLIAPGVYHEIEREPHQCLERYTIKFRYSVFENNQIQDFFPEGEFEEIMNTLKDINYFTFTDEHENISLIQTIREELGNRSIGYYSKIQSYFMQIIINILRSMTGNVAMKYDMPNRSIYDRRCMIIDDFFENYYDENVAIKDLCSILHISQKQLNRILLENYRITFKQKVVEKRIEVAKSLLRNTDLTIVEITNSLGYTSETNFCSLFKRKVGIAPNAFRLKEVY
jgi:AraC-like DNA-binding protein